MRRLFSILVFLTLNLFGQNTAAYIAKWTQEGDTMTVTVGWMARSIVVSGAPYYGVRISERDETRADGTHVSKAALVRQKMWRDSQGRMRTEQVIAGNGGEFIVADINDPVESIGYVMDDYKKVVHRCTLLAPPDPRLPRPKESTGRQRTFEQIGEKNVEGVVVWGTRVRETIPIGAAGNDSPSVSISEWWNSRELRMEILREMFDPRFGKGTVRMVDLSHAEPDATLFVPPADYSVVDEKDSFTMTLRRR
jgi:hypothetical protein